MQTLSAARAPSASSKIVRLVPIRGPAPVSPAPAVKHQLPAPNPVRVVIGLENHVRMNTWCNCTLTHPLAHSLTRGAP